MGFKTVRSKIVALLLLGGLCLALIAGVNIYNNYVLSGVMEVARHNQDMSSGVIARILLQNRYIQNQDPALYEQINQLNASIKAQDEKAGDIIEDAELLAIGTQLNQIIAKREQNFLRVVEVIKTMTEARKEMTSTMAQVGAVFQKTLDAITEEETQKLMFGEDIDAKKLAVREVYKNLLLFISNKYINLQGLFVLADLDAYNSQLAELQKRLKLEIDNTALAMSTIKDDVMKADWDKASKMVARVNELETMIVNGWRETRGLEAAMDKNSREIIDKDLEMAAILADKNAAISSRSELVNLIVLIAGGIAFILLGALIIRSVQKALSSTIGGVEESADRVGTAASEVARSSKSLAEGANSQAASLEEISASLEEMASMTKAESRKRGPSLSPAVE
jgi:hypothetical protein